MKNFKKGDKVVMHTCGEAKYYNGIVWTCSGDSYENNGGESVFLENFSGHFYCQYLQLVDTSDIEIKAYNAGHEEGTNNAANDILSNI